MAFCSICGKPIGDTVTFCPYCGTRTELPTPAPVPTPVPVPTSAGPAEAPESAYTGYSTGGSIPEPGYQPGGYGQNDGYRPGGYGPEPGYQPGSYDYGDYNFDRRPGRDWQENIHAKEAAEKATQTVSGMMGAYKKALGVLARKPIMLWGLSLLYSFLTVLAVLFSLLPIIWIPINLVLELGVSAIYLSGIRGESVNSDQLFAGFKQFFKNAGGMGWRTLWSLIWGIVFGLVIFLAVAAFGTGGGFLAVSYFGVGKKLWGVILLIVGLVLLIIGIVGLLNRSYAYAFVPYILLSDESLSGTEALRRSKELTRGWKLKMIASVLVPTLIYGIITGILTWLGRITDGFFLFTALFFIISLVWGLFANLFFGLVQAAFFEMASAKEE